MTPKRTNVSGADLGALLVYATRYALGRMSTAASTMSSLIQAHISGVSDTDLGVVLRDILEYPKRCLTVSRGWPQRPEEILGDRRYGQPCDQQDWRMAAEAIVAEQARRNRN